MRTIGWRPIIGTHSECMKSLEELRPLVLTTSILAAEGLDPSRTGRWVRHGVLVRLRRGAYVRSGVWESLGSRDREILRLVAYDAVARARPVFCRESAALVHGLASLSGPPRIHVLSRSNGHSSEDVVSHRVIRTSHEVGGLRTTGLEDTLLDCALGLPKRDALVILESALWPSRATPSGHPDLRDLRTDLELRLSERVAGSKDRGSRAARAWWGLVSSLSESPGESMTKIALWDHRLPPPLQQHAIGGYRTDFAWPESGVVLEFDGEIKYADDSTAAEVARKERRRHVALSNAGWTVVRTNWAEVVHRPWELAERLRRAGVGSHRR